MIDWKGYAGTSGCVWGVGASGVEYVCGGSGWNDLPYRADQVEPGTEGRGKLIGFLGKTESEDAAKALCEASERRWAAAGRKPREPITTVPADWDRP